MIMNNFYKKNTFFTLIAAMAMVFLIPMAVYAVTTVGNNTSVGGTLGVTGASTLSSTLAVTGNATSSGFLVVGTTSPANNMAAGDLLLGGNATTTGDLVITGGDLNKNAAALTVGGAVSLASTLTVTGKSTLTGNATSSGFLVVGTTSPTNNMAAGDLLLGGNATTTGDLVITGGDLNKDGTGLTIGGNASTTGDLVIVGGDLNKDGTALTIGSAVTLSKTTATGLTLSGTNSTAGIALTGTQTIGVSVANTVTTGINFAGGEETRPIKVGTLSSSVPGSGVELTTVNADNYAAAVDVNADDNNTARSVGEQAIGIKSRLMIYQENSNEDWAIDGLTKYSTVDKDENISAGVMGRWESAGASTITATGWGVAGVIGRIGTAGGAVAISDGARAAALMAFGNNANSNAFTGDGKYVGLWVLQSKTGTLQPFDYGVEIENSAATTGIQIGTATTGINLAGTNTTGISISGQNTTAIDITGGGAVTTGIDIGTAVTGLTFTGGYTTAAIQLGTSGSKITLAAAGDYAIDINTTSASTDTGTSVQPVHMISTMTGVGGVGGRALFEMDTEVVLGGWANALKGYTDFGTNGSVTGLGSAIVAEMRMPAKTLTAGTYAPLEIELVTQANGATGGTPVSFIYAELVGADATAKTDMATTGSVFNFAGMEDAAGGMWEAEVVGAGNVDFTHVLKILINGTSYYIGLNTAKTF